jgi:hemin uptake protein HemP
MPFAAPAFAPTNAPTRADTAPSDITPDHDARTLTQGGSVARILLDRQVYTLRITRSEKLILTK